MHAPLSALWLADIDAMEGDMLVCRDEARVLRLIARRAPDIVSPLVVGALLYPHLAADRAGSQVSVNLCRVRRKTKGVVTSFALVSKRGPHGGCRMVPASGTYTPLPPVPVETAAALLDLHWSPLHRAILDRLVLAGRRRLSTKTMADMVYGHLEGGGPDHALECIQVSVSVIRKRIKASGIGVRIGSRPRHGYRLEVAG